MKITTINAPVVVSKFEYHEQLKNHLLKMIDDSPGDQLVEKGDNISKTDWYIDISVDRPYLKDFVTPLINHLKKSYECLNIQSFEIHNFWYQQYYQNSKHSWHAHQAAQYTNVYYLELPVGAPKTEILDPLDPNKTFFADVQEGDIISFPAFIFHRSPVVENNLRKTVIAFNTSFIDLKE